MSIIDKLAVSYFSGKIHGPEILSAIVGNVYEYFFPSFFHNVYLTIVLYDKFTVSHTAHKGSLHR